MNNKNKIFILILGLFITFLSYNSTALRSFFPFLNQFIFINVTLTFGLFCVGLSLICESLTMLMKNFSLLREIFKTWRSFFEFQKFAIISLLLIELVAASIGKLWYYPVLTYDIKGFVTLLFEYSVIVFVYFMVILECLITSHLFINKFLLNRFRKFNNIFLKPFNKSFILTSGILFLFISIVGFGYEFVINNNYDFTWNKYSSFKPNFTFISLGILSAFLLLEYFAIRNNRKSIFTISLNAFIKILTSSLLATIILSILMETKNLANLESFWIYTNWPYASIKVFDLPIVMLIMWYFQDLMYIELLEDFETKPLTEIFFNE